MSQVVIGDVLPRTQAIAIAGQTIFGTNWTANYYTDVVVYKTPYGDEANDNIQILTTNQYSVQFIGDLQQVQITLVTPANAGDIITITRQTPSDRENLYTNTNFTPSMLNNDFGILTLVDQQAQLVNQLIAPRYNYSAEITDVVDTILPLLGPNQTWVKNSSNTAIIPFTINANSGSVDAGLQYQLAYYANSGNIVSGLSTANNSVLVTNSSGRPSLSTTLPNSLNIPTPVITNPLISTAIYDVNNNKIIGLNSITNSVNYLQVSNNTTGDPIILDAIGNDTNIQITINGKGTDGVAIKGDSGGSSVSAGYVGEILSINVPSTSAVSLTNSTIKNVTSLTLTPGDWDIYGNVVFQSPGNNIGTAEAWISNVSATRPDLSLINGLTALYSGTDLFSYCGVNTLFYRINTSTTTIVYLECQANFTSTATACGNIFARRRR